MASRLGEIAELNWRCVGVFDQATLVGLSGYWINTRLYCGKYLYIDHFIIDEERRRSGIGALLLDHLKQLAKEEQCEHVCLDTFVSNSLASPIGRGTDLILLVFTTLLSEHTEIKNGRKILARHHL